MLDSVVAADRMAAVAAEAAVAAGHKAAVEPDRMEPEAGHKAAVEPDHKEPAVADHNSEG